MQNRNKLTVPAEKKVADYSLKSAPILVKNNYSFKETCPLPNGIIGYLGQQKLVIIDFQKNTEIVISLPRLMPEIQRMVYFVNEEGIGHVLFASYNYGNKNFLILNLENLNFQEADEHTLYQVYIPPINSLVALSNHLFATCHQDKVEIWDSANSALTEIANFNSKKWTVTKLVKLSDNRLLGFAEFNTGVYGNVKSLIIWNSSRKKFDLGENIPNYSLIEALPENQVVFTKEKTMYFWDTIPTLTKRGSIKTTAKITSLLPLLDGRLVSGHENGQIALWDISSRKCIFTFRFSSEPVLDMQMLSDFTFVYHTQKQFFKANIGLNESLINQYFKPISAILPHVPIDVLKIISNYAVDSETALLEPKEAKFVSRSWFFNMFGQSEKKNEKEKKDEKIQKPLTKHT